MKNYRSTLLIIVTLAFFQAAPFALAAGGSLFQSKEFKKTVNFESGGDLRINTDKGSVSLTSWNQNEVEVYARIEAPERVDSDYARRAVEGAKIEVTGDARSLTIRSNFDGVPTEGGFMNESKHLPNIHYEIRAPRNLNLSLEIDRSKLSISGFDGRADVNADRTPVTASDLTGEIRMRIDRGEGTFSRLRGRLDFETDRTDSRLDDVSIEGDSRIGVDRGVFEMRLPQGQALSVNADISKRGGFSTDFPIAMQTKKGNSFEGTINGGGPRLSIEADRAKISLKQ